MESAPFHWRAPALLLVVAVTLGTALRLAPCIRNPGFENAWDGQYHERLTRQVLASGRLAEVDSLSNAPVGRPTASHLPTGLYFAGAWVHRVLRALGSRNLLWNLALMQSLAGALIALPAWLAAAVVFRNRGAAAVAATLAVFMPAHLGRTMGNDLRYDSLGTLLVTTHVALALAALAESRPSRRWGFSIGAALAFVAAMSVWRVSLLVLIPELAYAVPRFVLRGPGPAGALWLSMALVGTLGLLPVRYLTEHGFLLSSFWLFVVGFGIVLAIPGIGGRWPLRAVALAAIATIALVAGRAQTTADYAGLASMLKAKLGWTHGHDPDAALMLSVVELQGTGLLRFLTSGYFFSMLGVVFLLSPFLFWWVGGRPSTMRVLGMEAAPATLGLVALTFGIATLLFQRSCVLLAPIIAILVGGLLALSWARIRAEPARRSARRGQRSRRVARLAGSVGVAVLAMAALTAMASSIPMAWNRVMRLAPNERKAIEFLRTHARPGAVVMCDWDAGYEIQSRAGLATVTDGLLESAENRRRIVELYAAMMDPTSAPLEALCRRYRAGWLLLPTSSSIYAMASVTGDPLAEILARHEGVPRGPLTDHMIVHLFERDAEYPGLRRAVEVGGFTVFEVVDPS
jgi:asparagine N-glycosylation enzyme membrane subunit Stt3